MKILGDVEPEVQHKAKEHHRRDLQQHVHQLHSALGGVHDKELGDEHGAIEQDADIVLFLYRSDYYKNNDDVDEDMDKNSGECIVAKNRHGETRVVPLHWQGEFMRFTAKEVRRNDY